MDNRNFSALLAGMGLLTATLMTPHGSAQAQATLFARLPLAVGVEADRAGNVYVSHSTYPYNYLSKFTRNGALVARVAYQGVSLIGDNGRIARIPGSDSMLMLGSTGMIYLFGPGLNQPLSYIDFRFLAGRRIFDVYDITLQTFRNANLAYVVEWGDIAAIWRNNRTLSLYLTAVSAGFPFVFRADLDVVDNRIFWRPILTSTGTTAGSLNRPRGIAVNSKGWVLTGLPAFVLNAGYMDSLVAFPTGFPENRLLRPGFILRTSAPRSGVLDMPSVGMATDVAGNFYVDTGPFGSSLCGVNRSSALVLINSTPTLPNPRCSTVPAVISASNDVAVSPVGNIPYMTFGNLNITHSVIKFNPLVPSASAMLSTAAAPVDSGNAGLGKLLELRHLPLEEAR